MHQAVPVPLRLWAGGAIEGAGEQIAPAEGAGGRAEGAGEQIAPAAGAGGPTDRNRPQYFAVESRPGGRAQQADSTE